MSAASRTPLELWLRVFEFAAADTDECAFVHFWNNCRQVCHAWRANIPTVYLETFIKSPARCIIDFDVSRDYDLKISKRAWKLNMVFDRLDPNDKSRCIFKESEKTGRLPEEWDADVKEAYIATKYERWQENIGLYLGADADEEAEGGNFDLPPYVLSIYGCSNDSELPNLKMDDMQREISFEWEGMLTAFCLELAELDRRHAGHSKSLAKTIILDFTDLTKTAKTMLDALEVLKGMISSDRRDVRRHRIKKFYKERYGHDFNVFDEQDENGQLMRIERLEDIGRGMDEMGSDESDEEESDESDEEESDESDEEESDEIDEEESDESGEEESDESDDEGEECEEEDMLDTSDDDAWVSEDE